MLRPQSAEFVRATSSAREYPGRREAEFAFMGRSNVGKSSLLNTLVGKRKLAHVGGTPGRTRSINFYLINQRYYFVDLPGYGYARVSKQERSRWKKNIEAYLGCGRLDLGVVLVDARVGPTPDDLMLTEWLRTHGLSHLIVLTKSDKLSRGKLLRLVPEYADKLGVAAEQLLPFSSRTGQGRRELLTALARVLPGRNP